MSKRGQRMIARCEVCGEDYVTFVRDYQLATTWDFKDRCGSCDALQSAYNHEWAARHMRKVSAEKKQSQRRALLKAKGLPRKPTREQRKAPSVPRLEGSS